eukprot:TRINITY_DN1481_c1_g1_i3.p2 TRINITY_DN1481_c1_g1~~TRINITY_DN1481_c1_g1_i3.p2  ORF type:complete len:118 (-),score=29.49 TRINITY_DN1481_c1_g1_i3:159-512(-)
MVKKTKARAPRKVPEFAARPSKSLTFTSKTVDRLTSLSSSQKKLAEENRARREALEKRSQKRSSVRATVRNVLQGFARAILGKPVEIINYRPLYNPSTSGKYTPQTGGSAQKKKSFI